MFTFAVIINTLDMSEKDVKPPEERLSKRKSICSLYADSIYKTNPTIEQIKGVLMRVFDTAYSEGYDSAILDTKRMRGYKDSKLNEGFLNFRQEIEDAIHKNR